MKAAPCFFLSATAIFAIALPLAARASTTTVVYSFKGAEDGEYTDTDIVMDAKGNLYGTSVQGGDFGSGTVWKLSPRSDGSWKHKVLYSFTGGADGGEPYKGVTLDAKGNLYGTTVTGGGGACEGGCGVAYELIRSGKVWTQQVIHTFNGPDDGQGPGARLTVDDAGNVYGMAPTGGAYGAGTIYRIRQMSGNWTLDVLHAFTGGRDGAGGSAGAMVLRNGNLYGAATTGGGHGQGTVYELSPRTNGSWKFRVVYAFRGDPNVGFPYGGLTFDSAGNAYGTAYYDGHYDVGGVYQLVPSDTGRWKEHLLYSFKGGSDGANSIANVVLDSAGNIYGTTSEAGSGGQGVIFAMTLSGGKWHESVAHAFTGAPDGAFPYNGMVGDGAGTFYGATVHGGEFGEGAIYKFTP